MLNMSKKTRSYEQDSTSQYQQLHDACEKGDAITVKSILKQPITWKSYYQRRPSYRRGMSALHISADKGHDHIVNLLLQYDFDAHVRDKLNFTAVEYAKNISTRKVFKQHGVDIDKVEKNVELWDAVNNERMEDVQFLLTQGARGDWNNPRAIKCRSALHIVVYHYDMCKELLKYPTDIDVKDEDNQTPLHHAAFNGRLDIVDLFVTHKANIHSKDWNDWTPIFFAVFSGVKEVVEYFINKNVDVFIKDKCGKTPLDRAEEEGHADIVELLKAELSPSLRSLFSNLCIGPSKSSPSTISSSSSSPSQAHSTSSPPLQVTPQDYNMSSPPLQTRTTPVVSPSLSATESPSFQASSLVFHSSQESSLDSLSLHMSPVMSPPLQTTTTPTVSPPLHTATSAHSAQTSPIQNHSTTSPSIQSHYPKIPPSLQTSSMIDYGHDKDSLPFQHHHSPAKVFPPLQTSPIQNHSHAKISPPRSSKYSHDITSSPLDYETEIYLKKDESYRDMFDRAMDEGYIITKWSKLFLSGAPGTGKTSLLKLLLGEAAPDCHHSTPFTTEPEIRRVQTNLIASNNHLQQSLFPTHSACQWGQVSLEDFQELLAQALKNSIRPPCFDRGISEDNDVDSLPQSLNCPVSPPMSPKVQEELVRLIPEVKEDDYLYQAHWIHVIDSGGQSAFLDVAPALLRYYSASIITLRLTDKLSDPAQFYYSFDGTVIGRNSNRQLSNLEVIESSFRSLASVCQPSLHNVHIKCSHILPYSFIVGTFYDQYNDSIGESLFEKNFHLLEKLKHYNNTRIDYNEPNGEIIIPVNAVGRSDHEQFVASLLRNRVCESYIEAEIPIRWFVFQLEIFKKLRGTKKEIITFQECRKVGKELHMKKKDVEAALLYYHDLTVFLYFPTVLPDIVFTHPQPLYDKLSELICFSFSDLSGSLPFFSLGLPPGAHSNLKNKGIFTKELLRYVSSEFTETFTAEDFLKIMEHLLIIAKLPNKEGIPDDHYFIPCVLPSVTFNRLGKPLFLESVDPLILTWDFKPIPQGLFTALTVQLLNRQISPMFRLDTSGDASLQYRNIIQLNCHDIGGAVLLVDATYYLEVYYSGQPTKCCAIRNAIREGVTAVVTKFQYIQKLAKPDDAFFCSGCGNNATPHLCLPNKDREVVTCAENKISVRLINKTRQLPWFSCVSQDVQVEQIDILNRRPVKYDLLSKLSKIAYDWLIIGESLKVPFQHLQEIDRLNCSNVEKLSKVLQKWLDGMYTAVTWATIIDAIAGEIVQKPAVAMEIREHLQLVHV